jgi:hypothetical protein
MAAMSPMMIFTALRERGEPMYKRIYDSDEIMVDHDGQKLRVSVFDDGHWVGEHFVELPEMEPVVHARWEVVRGVITPGGDPLLRCPRCRSRESEHLGGIECNRAHWNYCPICGAHMDEEVSE